MRNVLTTRSNCSKCDLSLFASHWAYVRTVLLRGFPAPVTVAIRDQASGGNGFNTAINSARWAVKAFSEGQNSSSG
jgi:hypothetical protein